MNSRIIFTLLLSGLLFGVGPCLANCGPVIISYIAGTGKNIFKSLLAYIIFSLSRIAVYVLLALLVFFVGILSLERLLGSYAQYIFIIGGGFIILIGLLMLLGRGLDIKFCQFFKRNLLEKDKKSIILFGLTMGLLPCAPLLAILSYIGLVSRFWFESIFYSLIFGLGTFFSPLILLCLFAGFLPRLISGKERFYLIFRVICGLIIIFFGIQLFRRGI